MKKLLIVMTIWIPFTLICCTPLAKTRGISNLTVQVEDIKNTHTKLVTITGNNSDSATFIKEYAIVFNASSVDILIKKSLNNSGIENPYHIQFVMKDTVEKITLSGEVIWRKPQP